MRPFAIKRSELALVEICTFVCVCPRTDVKKLDRKVGLNNTMRVELKSETQSVGKRRAGLAMCSRSSQGLYLRHDLIVSEVTMNKTRRILQSL